MDRLAQFEAAMAEVDRPRPAGRVASTSRDAPSDDLSIDDLVAAAAGRRADRRGAALELAPGDRLLVSGPSGAGKSSLFRALAGTLAARRRRDRASRRTRACSRCRSGRISRSARCARR